MKSILFIIISICIFQFSFSYNKYCDDWNTNQIQNTRKSLCFPNENDFSKGFCAGANQWSGDDRDLLPPWLNISLAIKGQQFASNHFIWVTHSYVAGNLIILANPQIRDTLLFTGNSNTPTKAGRRYASTLSQVSLWLRRALSQDIDKNWVLTSLSQIRNIHNHVAIRIQLAMQNFSFYDQVGLNSKPALINIKMWLAFQRDLQNSDIPLQDRIYKNEVCNKSHPMNQLTFAITQWAFIGSTFILFEDTSDQEGLMSYAHLLAIVGYALGIEDRFNLGLSNNMIELKEMHKDLYNNYIRPHLFNLDTNSKLIMESYTLGMRNIIPFWDKEFIQRFTLSNILRIDPKNMKERRTSQGEFLDWLYEIIGRVNSVVPGVDMLLSPLFSLYHFVVGRFYFPDTYTSDEFVAKYSFYY